MDALDYAKLPLSLSGREELKRLDAERVRRFREKAEQRPSDIQKHHDEELIRGRLRDRCSCLIDVPPRQREQWLREQATRVLNDTDMREIVGEMARKHLAQEDYLTLMGSLKGRAAGGLTLCGSVHDFCDELLAELPGPGAGLSGPENPVAHIQTSKASKKRDPILIGRDAVIKENPDLSAVDPRSSQVVKEGTASTGNQPGCQILRTEALVESASQPPPLESRTQKRRAGRKPNTELNTRIAEVLMGFPDWRDQMEDVCDALDRDAPDKGRVPLPPGSKRAVALQWTGWMDALVEDPEWVRKALQHRSH